MGEATLIEILRARAKDDATYPLYSTSDLFSDAAHQLADAEALREALRHELDELDRSFSAFHDADGVTRIATDYLKVRLAEFRAALSDEGSKDG